MDRREAIALRLIHGCHGGLNLGWSAVTLFFWLRAVPRWWETLRALVGGP
jgi:hypothetical protein